MPAIQQPLKWHGGKRYMAARLHAIAADIPYVHRVHPYAGGLGEFWNWPHEGVSEVVNDTDGRLTNFYCILQREDAFAEFVRLVEAVPFSEAEWNTAEAYEAYHDYGVFGAAMFFIYVRQSMAGRMKDFATLSRRRTRRGMNEQVAAWLSAVDGLLDVHYRLRRVAILNRPALDVIRQQDGPETLFYCDPPYVHATRSSTGEYACEMGDVDHMALAAELHECHGSVMLSGYRCDLYDTLYGDWVRHDFELPNNAAGGRTKRRMTECVWVKRGT